MTIREHPAVPPEQCARCRQVLAVLADDESAEPPTAAAIGRAIGLSDRSVRLHLAHLRSLARLEPDGRTVVPVAAAELHAESSALEWAAQQEAPDAACAALLRAVALRGWKGSVGRAELAAAAGMAERSVSRHRPHLAALVEWEPDYHRRADGSLDQGAKRFRLVATLQLGAPGRPLRSTDYYERQAAELLAQVVWLPGADASNPYVLMRVAEVLAQGLPPQDALRRFSAKPPRRMTSGAAVLLSRLPLPGSQVRVLAVLTLPRRPAAAPVPAPIPVPAARPSVGVPEPVPADEFARLPAGGWRELMAQRAAAGAELPAPAVGAEWAAVAYAPAGPPPWDARP